MTQKFYDALMSAPVTLDPLEVELARQDLIQTAIHYKERPHIEESNGRERYASNITSQKGRRTYASQRGK